jgi:hypothetical protein
MREQRARKKPGFSKNCALSWRNMLEKPGYLFNAESKMEGIACDEEQTYGTTPYIAKQIDRNKKLVV